MNQVDAPEALIGVAELVAAALRERRSDPVVVSDTDQLTTFLHRYDFRSPVNLHQATVELLTALRRNAVRSDHPRYLGLFNPPSHVAGIAGDLIAAAINPQLAVHSHAPAASAIERHLVRFFGEMVWGDASCGGTFTSGGTEANHTALLAALATRYPSWARDGLRGLPRQPVIFTSAESHLAWIKLARACGLGSDSVRLVPADDGLSMSGEALAAAIAADRTCDPVMVVATAGTTAHGAIDDLKGVSTVGRAVGAHVHVDAAWAGAALMEPGMRTYLAGIEQAETVTIDPHKWLSVPMGAGLLLAREWTGLEKAFSVSTGYMPSASLENRDPYIHSLQWSRRFIGAKVFLALASLGIEGYGEIMRRQAELAQHLRSRLVESGWLLENDTPLPLVCFSPRQGAPASCEEIAARVVGSGMAWLSTVWLRGRVVLRACLTSFETTRADIDAVVDALSDARARGEGRP